MNDLTQSVWQRLVRSEGEVPFSMQYGGKCAEIRAAGEAAVSTEGLTVRDYRVLGSDLQIRAEIKRYGDAPAVEWVLHLTNTGGEDSAICENINVLDIKIRRDGDPEYMLNTLTGCASAAEDFTPQRRRLWYWDDCRLGCLDGRSSDDGQSWRRGGVMPTFDLEYDGATLICAVGWTGTWYARFIRTDEKDLQFMAGWDHVRFKLLPGETVRTPRIVLFHWDGPPEQARNAYRQFILKHHTPKIDGQIPAEIVSTCSWGKYRCGQDCTEENQKAWIDQQLAANYGLNTFWLDAGWYGEDKPWGLTVGDWTPTDKNWPNGLEPIGRYARDNGLGFVLWFEPERVAPGTFLWNEHPEWLLVPNEDQTRRRMRWLPQSEALLNLGIREAAEWFVETVTEIVQRCGVTVYRQDMNFPPDEFWSLADAPDRRGISEIRHIEGLYWMWDELLRRNPGLLIDNCASGGRRIDLEACRRSIPLWRNDWPLIPPLRRATPRAFRATFP